MKAVWRPVSMRRMGALGTSPALLSIAVISAHDTASSAAHARRRRVAPASHLLLARVVTVMVLLDVARGRYFDQSERVGADVFTERAGAEIIVAQAQSAHITRCIDDVVTHSEHVRHRAAHQRAAAEIGGLRHAASPVHQAVSDEALIAAAAFARGTAALRARIGRSDARLRGLGRTRRLRREFRQLLFGLNHCVFAISAAWLRAAA